MGLEEMDLTFFIVSHMGQCLRFKIYTHVDNTVLSGLLLNNPSMVKSFFFSAPTVSRQEIGSDMAGNWPT